MTGWWKRAVPAALLVLCATIWPGAGGAAGEAVPLDAQGRPRYVPGEVLVLMRPGVPPSALGGPASALTQAGLARRMGAADSPYHRLRLQPGVPVRDAVAELAGDPAVAAAAPNYLYYKLFTTDDPYYLDGSLWGFLNTGQRVTGGYANHNPPASANHDIDAPEAWDLGVSGAGQVVAIIDDGLRYTHAELAPNLQDTSAFVQDPSPNFGYDYAGALGGAVDDPDNDPVPIREDVPNSHGTHVAGIVAALKGNAAGGLGTAYGARVLGLKVFPDDDTGATDADIISAINYVRLNGIPIANMSLGRSGTDNPVMRQAVQDAIAAGVLFTVAAGNGGKDGKGDDNDQEALWPANYANVAVTEAGVITVAATDQADELASFSNFGRHSVSVAAPGVNIWSTVTLPGPPSVDDWAPFSGTSMAAPMVAGVAALVREKMLADGLTPTPADLKARIVNGGELVPALRCRIGSGKRVNAFNAVAGNATPDVDNAVCDNPILLLQGEGSSTCLITWLSEDYVPRRALEPLRKVREFLWQQGSWGKAVVRFYYRASAAIIARLARPRAQPTAESPALALP